MTGEEREEGAVAKRKKMVRSNLPGTVYQHRVLHYRDLSTPTIAAESRTPTSTNCWCWVARSGQVVAATVSLDSGWMWPPLCFPDV
ncbi:hypothetical protein E2562_021313 [Oryza meyeriana var. granulata]|uniref:Uncharacterized protein n=1 Tax=Oryza meyeriana var. granulata TaxID=110450 RepID=A0A6G1BYN8_9ORYZ|nr:hypothetical protein E2562_021313 [Oryza meyeriana var. granulata]